MFALNDSRLKKHVWQTPLHIWGRVFPIVAVRQWGLVAAFRPRYRIAADARPHRRSSERFHSRSVWRIVSACFQSAEASLSQGGAVTFIQHFGGRPERKPLFPALVTDSVYAARAAEVSICGL